LKKMAVCVTLLSGGLCIFLPRIFAASTLTGSPSYVNASSVRRALRSHPVAEQQYDAKDGSLGLHSGRNLPSEESSLGAVRLDYRRYQSLRRRTERRDEPSASYETGHDKTETTILVWSVWSAILVVFCLCAWWFWKKSRSMVANAHREQNRMQQPPVRPAAAAAAEPSAAPASPVASQPEREPPAAFSRQGSLVRSLSTATGEPEHEPPRDVASTVGSRPHTPTGNVRMNSIRV